MFIKTDSYTTTPKQRSQEKNIKNARNLNKKPSTLYTKKSLTETAINSKMMITIKNQGVGENMKKGVSILLCMCLLFSASGIHSFAVGNNEKSVPFIITAAEKVNGVVQNTFAKFFNLLGNKDESDIPSPSEFAPSWTASGENLFNGDGEFTVETQTWLMTEVTFESDTAYADPFRDVDVDLLLFGNGRLYTIPTFWNGENEWVARFVCPEEGVWQIKTVCTDKENTSLHGRTGIVNCTKYNGDREIYQHGFVTTKAGQKYFTYDDGTPFFYLGDTHWSLGDETVDMVKTIAEKRVSQGFTVWQSEPIGAKFDLTDGVTEADMPGFDDYDEKFKIIADSGLVHANAQFFFTYFMEPLIANHGGYSDKTITVKSGKKTVTMHDLSDSAKLYLEKISRYWVARYGAYPVIWTLGQEADNDFYWNDTTHPDWNYVNNPYKLVAEYIAKYDPYTHPLSAHQENAGATAAYGNGRDANDKCKVYFKNSSASCFREVPAHNFYAAQWHPSKTEQSSFEVEKDYWYNSQGKPVVNYEGQYCYLWTKNFGSRMQGWTAFLNGMYGYGWGAHDTWSYLNIYDEENDSSDGVDTITSQEKISATWEDALEYESSYQVGYMRNFFQKLNWWELVPRFDNKAYFVPCNNVYYTYASNKDNSEIVLYFYSFTNESVAQTVNTKFYGGIKTGTVGSLEPNGEYTYQWFDPITGETSEEQRFTATIFGTHYIGNRPDDTDMALIIRKS